MTLRLRAFVVWLLLPFMSIVSLYFVLRWPAETAPTIAATIFRSFRSNAGVLISLSCLAQAVLGTTILWGVSIRQAWTGILIGVVIAASVIALSTWLELTFFGGFEANVGICLTALVLLLPSCLAAAYAGVLRSREQ